MNKMTTLTPQQATQLAKNYLEISRAIGDFIYNKRDTLSEEEQQELGNLHYMIIKKGEDIHALSTTLVMENAHDSLTRINTITTHIRKNIKSLKNIQKGIDVSASIVALGCAIIQKDCKAIDKSIEDVFAAWN